MITSPEIIIALAEAYSVQELQDQITALSKQLAESGGWISSASSGGGTTYQRQQDMPLPSRIALLRRALAYKQGDPSSTAVSSITPVAIDSVNN